MTDFRALLADDAFAASFQSLGQYRTALLVALAQSEPQGPTDEELEATARAAELLSMKKQGGLTSPTPDGIHAQLQEQRLAGLRAVAALAQPEPDVSQLSDGYHTFAELYEHRHALCLALMRAMPQHCWFSLRHADGERCFGGTDWFIFGVELPGAGSVTYHLPVGLYPIAQATGAAELEKGRPWDGHTAADVVSRLRDWAALAQPEPQGPTDEELQELASGFFTPTEFHFVDFARAALTRWGRTAIEPVPVVERLPGPEDCDAEGRCWFGGKRGIWMLMTSKYAKADSFWLPHHALPVPQQEGDRG